MQTNVRFRTKVPTYRKRKGTSQAVVTLMDAQTRQRRDYWLGEFGDPGSREGYHRLIAAWESAGRRLPSRDACGTTASIPIGVLTITEVVRDYSRWAEGYYRPKHWQSVVGALRLLKQYFGRLPASGFGPKNLQLLRDEMIRGDKSATPPRRPWARRYINAQVQRVRHIFKWAAARELIAASVHQSLCTLEPLRRGRCGAHDNPKVGPVPEHLLDGARQYLSRPVRAVVELQLLTGARPGELLGLRPIDIEMDGDSDVWIARPDSHKNAHREKDRVIYMGPKARGIIGPFLTNRSTDAFLFSPVEAERERRIAKHLARRTPKSCGNRPGTNRMDTPKRAPRARYTTGSYARAIHYACVKAFPLPEALAKHPGESDSEWMSRMGAEQHKEVRAWRRSHHWHPHQLRHNAATLLRREFGLEAAQLTLGHASAQLTDAVYAERDRGKVIEIMRKIG